MKRSNVLFGTIGCSVCFMLCHGPARIAFAESTASEASHVLVVHSYNPEFAWTQALQSGVDRAFEKSHHDVVVYHEFLDGKRFPEMGYREDFLTYIQNKYRDTSLEALIISDDPGLNFLLTVHDSHFPDTPFVFMGVNSIQERLLTVPWLTGVFENHDVVDTIVEAKRQTGSDSVVVIVDSTETGLANVQKLKGLKGREDAPQNIIIEEDVVSTSIGETLDPYPDHWPIFINGQLREGGPKGPLIGFERETKLLTAEIPNPIYVDTRMRVENGALGGKVLDGYYHAEQAVELVEKILDGQPVSEISPILESRNQWTFNAEALKRSQITQNQLPAESILINQKPSFYEQYAKLVWLAVAIAFVGVLTISVLAVAIRKQQIAEQKLKTSERELEKRVDERTLELTEALDALQSSQKEIAQRSEELSKKNCALIKAQQHAEQANAAKSQFLASMSHELRTPLNSILGFSQLMERDLTLPDKHRQTLSIIDRSGEHLLTLINDVLELSKIESGKTELHARDFDLFKLLESLYEMFSLKADDKGVDYKIKYDLSLPRYIHGDEIKLRQVLLNLLSNALKFTNQGYVYLKVDASSEQINFVVEDTGVGIDQSDLNALFEPFTQTEVGWQSGQGTGLGLPISHSFVSLMGGTLAVESQKGCGSTFTFSLPLTLARAMSLEKSGKQVKKYVIGLAENQTIPKLLVVEDDANSQAFLVKLLSSVGLTVRAVGNGQEAVDVCRSWCPHLVWMDMQMPVMNGGEATRLIKAQSQPPIVIALTAHAFEGDRASLHASGCDDVLCKPCAAEDIWCVLATHLGLKYRYAKFDETTKASLPLAAGEDQRCLAQLQTTPLAWRESLQSASTRLSNSEVQVLLNQLPPHHSVLKTELDNLLCNFRHDLILEMLEKNSS